MATTRQTERNGTIPRSLIDHVTAYASQGYATFATQTDKRPLHGVKWLESKVDRAPNPMGYPCGMFGVRLKEDDLIIDLDPRNMQGRKVWSELKEKAGITDGIEDTMLVRTQSGGMHIYLRKPPHIQVRKNMTEFPGVDFLSKGSYVLGGGSRGYEIIRSPFKCKDAPAGLLDLIQRRPQTVDHGDIRHKGFQDTDMNKERFVEYLTTIAPIAVEGENGDVTTFKVACRGRDLNLTPATTHALMLEHYDPQCQPPWGHDELLIKVRNAYVYNEDMPGKNDPATVLPDLPPLTEDKEWKDRLDRAKGGKLLPTLKNAVILLQKEVNMQGMFALNLFTEQLEVRGTVPWDNKRINKFREINDREIEHIRFYFANTFGVEFASLNLWKAVDLVAANNHYHPVQDHVNAMKWDGVPRIDNWLMTYCGVEGSRLHSEMGRLFMLGMVGRVLSPGCKFDYVLVLEGPQGIGKSTACSILGGPWFGDAPIDPKDKDSIPYIHSHWVIELSEMLTTKRSDIDRMKSFVSCQVDDVRLPYARSRTKYPRQCVFVGTVNPDDSGYLSDITGNRRYWCVTCSKFDLAGLKRDRDQLIAEAVSIWKTRKPELFLERELEKESWDAAALRMSIDPWQNMLELFLKTHPELTRVTTAEMFRDALGGQVLQMHTGHQRRIAACLKQLGWEFYRTAQGHKYVLPVKKEKEV